MAIIERLTTPLADGTALTTANSGASAVTASSGNTVTWQGGRAQFSGIAAAPCLARFALNAANAAAQITFRFEVPPTLPANPVTFFAYRSSGGRIIDWRYLATGAIACYDSAQFGSTILNAGVLSAGVEYVVKTKIAINGTTSGVVGTRFETVGGVLVGTESNINNSNLGSAITAANWDCGGSMPASTTCAFKIRNVRANDGPGNYLDDYVSSIPLAAPVVSETNLTNPTTIGGNNGAITIAWSPVPNATSYEVDIADGNVQSGFDTGLVGTSPWTFSGLLAGVYTEAVRAMP